MKTMICGLNGTPGWENTITAVSTDDNKYPIVHGVLHIEMIKETIRLVVDIHTLSLDSEEDASAIRIGKQLVLSEFAKLYKRVFFRDRTQSSEIMFYIAKEKPSDTAFAMSAEFLL